ncbi:MAG: VanZ family protein [Dysgonamonadaceae bacterium]|nr:VanZ family protein [Dysgonamonadaceae bacterium]
MKKFRISVFLTVLILFLCFINLSDIPENMPVENFDKFVHFLMFFALSGAIFFDNTAYFKRQISLNRIFWGSFLFPTLFSGFIELLQEYLSSTRTGDWIDFLFDGIGAFLGIVICFLINSKLPSASGK